MTELNSGLQKRQVWVNIWIKIKEYAKFFLSSLNLKKICDYLKQKLHHLYGFYVNKSINIGSSVESNVLTKARY